MKECIELTVLHIVPRPISPAFETERVTNRVEASISTLEAASTLLPSDSTTIPTIAPDRAQQAFIDSPDGFGEWNIFISGAAVKHLREFRRADQKIFHIVQKKIKELSCGFFSASNQKRLVGGDDDIAIFEAKMTGDLRLVYQIDLQSDATVKV